jgi:outer membrane protein assembly factor BamB
MMKALTKLAVLLCALCAGSVTAGDAATLAGAIVEKTSARRGIVCVPQCGDGALPVALTGAGEMIVVAQDPRPEQVAAARKRALDAGLLNRRIYVIRNAPGKLSLATNYADAVVVDERCTIPEAELMRVVCPGGTLVRVIGGDVHVQRKPLLKTADDWSHWYHAPDGNAVSKDSTVGLPDAFQWLALPHHAATPSITLASAGRLFTAVGNNAQHRREEPSLNTLTARNGYNGQVLWTRKLPVGYVVFRSTFVATPDTFYMLDFLTKDDSVLMLDARTGKEKGRIALPQAGEQLKWLAIVDGTLYVMGGNADPGANTASKRDRTSGNPGGMQDVLGWESRPKGLMHYGYGATLVAWDLAAKREAWKFTNPKPIDPRTLTIGAGRMTFYSQGAHVRCLDAATGKQLWCNDNAEEVAQISSRNPKASEKIQTGAGAISTPKHYLIELPARNNVVVLAAATGKLLWTGQEPEKMQFPKHVIYVRDKFFMGLPPKGSRAPYTPPGFYDPDTGAPGERFYAGGGGCFRTTASADWIFKRGGRTNLTSKERSGDGFVRSDCWSGVTPANGLLYWTPMACDCKHDLTGAMARGPMDFKLPGADVDLSARLEFVTDQLTAARPLSPTAKDWSAHRAGPARTGALPVDVPANVRTRWTFNPAVAGRPAPPTAAGGLVFLGGDDGVVRCLDAATGEQRWTHTATGRVRVSPTVWNNRVLFGSDDGYVYCVEAVTGRRMWRFRMAPVERRIMLYGALSSAWPVTTGVLVQDGVAYAAAGILGRDGICVAALDAKTGKPKWVNSTAGARHISVQGGLVIAGGQLRLSSGMQVSPASFDLATGELKPLTGQYDSRRRPRMRPTMVKGEQIGVFGKNHIIRGGRPLYSERMAAVYRGRFSCLSLNEDGAQKATEVSLVQRASIPPAWDADAFIMPASAGKRTPPQLICWNAPTLAAFLDARKSSRNDLLGKGALMVVEGLTAHPPKELAAAPVLRWGPIPCEATAMALAKNAVVVASVDRKDFRADDAPIYSARALSRTDGKLIWEHDLPGEPLLNGICILAGGDIIIALTDGRVLCLTSP